MTFGTKQRTLEKKKNTLDKIYKILLVDEKELCPVIHHTTRYFTLQADFKTCVKYSKSNKKQKLTNCLRIFVKVNRFLH